MNSTIRYPSFIRAIKSRLSPLWWYSSVQFCTTRIVDLINIYIGAILVPSVISPDSLGAVLPLTNIIVLAGIPMTAVLTVALKYFNTFSVRGEKGQIKALLRDTSMLALGLSIILTIVLFLLEPLIQVRLKIENPWVIRVLAATMIASCWQPVARYAAQGLMRFRPLILSNLVASGIKLGLMIVLIHQFSLSGYLTANLIGIIASVAFLFICVRDYMSPDITTTSYRSHWPEMWYYCRHAAFMGLVIGFGEVIAPLAIRNFTSHMDSAGYYIAVAFGAIPFYASSALLPFMFSLTSERFEKGERTSSMLLQSTLAIMTFGSIFVVLLFYFGRNILELLAAWAIYADYSFLIWRVGIITTLNGIILSYMNHENACRRFSYMKFFVPTIILEIIILYSFMGWGFFQPYISESSWTRVNELIPNRLTFAIWVMMIRRIVLSAYILGHIIIMRKAESR